MDARPEPSIPPGTQARTNARTRALGFALAFCVGLLVLTLADHNLYALLLSPQLPPRQANPPRDIRLADWYQSLRVLGYLPFWGVLALALALTLPQRAPCTTLRARAGVCVGGMILTSALLGGALAELAKLIIRRERPNDLGLYVIDWLTTASQGPLGTASSHAGVAFGGAFMLARFFPQGRWLFLALATGCAATRLLVGAHFATDAYFGAGLGYAGCLMLWTLAGRRWSLPCVASRHPSLT
jgi:membrane-associated phospholipid phosphatase